MSKKNLLNESQVRQFMKLAKLEPLTPGFVEGLVNETHGRGTNDPGYGIDNTSPGRRVKVSEGEEELEDELHATERELGHEDEEANEEGDELDDMDAGLPAELPGPDGRTVSVDAFLSALEVALEDVMGDEVEIDSDELEDTVEDEVDVDAAEMEMDTDMEMDDEMLAEDQAYTSKKEKPGADLRKGADKRGAEGTKLKTGPDKGEDAYVNEEQGADDREDEHLGAKDGKESGKKQSMKDRRKEMRGARRAKGEAGDPVPTQEAVEATDDLVEQITKRVAARILKSALTKK